MIRRVSAILGSLLVALAAFLLWQQLDRPLRVVVVEGPLSAAEQQAVREVVSRAVPAGVLSIDLEALAADIRALSWPRAVHVRRVWPHSLAVSVDKEAPVAAWGEEGYLTSAGKIVRVPDLVADLPVLDARLSSPRQAMEVFLLLQKHLDAGGLRIARLRENTLGEWELTLASGLVLQLGNDLLTERLDRFMMVYRQVLKDEPQAGLHADARYGNGVAVSRPPSLLAMDQAASSTDKEKSSEYGFGQ
jgi:cell division protein FtsQ